MKRTFILLGALAVLVALVAGINKIAASRTPPGLFKGFDGALVTQVTLQKNGAREVLRLENKRWMATDKGLYPADSAKVAEMLGALAAQKQSDPVARNPKRHADLRVDSTAGTKVVVEAGKNQWVFFLGNMAQGYTGTYLRFDGKNEVYVTQGDMERHFSVNPNHYRDRTLARLNKDDVGEFSLLYRDPRDSTKVLECAAKFATNKGAWKFEKPEAVDGDGAKVNELLGRYAALQVDDWYDADTTTALGFENPEIRASFKKNDGGTVVIIAGREKDGNRYVKVEGDPNKYLLRKYRFDNLKPVMEELKAKAPAPGDSAGAASAPAGQIMTLPGAGN